MAVLFDAKTDPVFVFPGTSNTVAHTPAGVPSAVAVLIFHIHVNAATIGSVTYGGVACTLKDEATSSGDFNHVQIWGLANPPAGTQNAVVVTAAGASDYFGVAVVTVTGSDLTTCFTNSNHATNNTDLPAVTTASAVGDLVLDALMSQAQNSTGGQVGQTPVFVNFTVSSWFMASSTKAGASPVVTMNWTMNLPRDWSHVAVSFKDAGGGGGAPAKRSYGFVIG